MTVRELIEQLGEYDQGLEVVVHSEQHSGFIAPFLTVERLCIWTSEDRLKWWPLDQDLPPDTDPMTTVLYLSPWGTPEMR